MNAERWPRVKGRRRDGQKELNVGKDANTKKTARMDRERRRRLEREALNRALAVKRCQHCGIRGAWTIYNVERTRGRIRYVRCLGCNRSDQVTVVVREEAEDPSTNSTNCTKDR